MPKLHIYKSEKDTCYAFAEWLTALVNETLQTQDQFTIALPGEELPKTLFKILETDYAYQIDWGKIHVFLGEERLISFSEDKIKTTSIVKTLQNEMPIPSHQFHLIKNDLSPQDSSKQYEELLHSYFNDTNKTFDLVILGLGEQGSVLSLLPFAEENHYRDNWVIPVYDEKEDLFKVTLTIAAINAAATKAFVVTGKRKEEVVQKVLKGKYEPEKLPAQLIVSANEPIHWFLDEAAAGRLIKPFS